MFYPAKFITHLVSRLPDGSSDELHHEEHVMVSLRDDGTWALRYNDPENGGQTMLQGTPRQSHNENPCGLAKYRSTKGLRNHRY